MSFWNGYILFAKTANLNQTKFDALCNAYRVIEPVDPLLPADMMATLRKPDNSAEIFECKFDPAAVDVASFKQFMANLFGVSVEDVAHEILEDVSYSGLSDTMSRRWGFDYLSVQRLQVVRFGRGGLWQQSQIEAYSYKTFVDSGWE